MTLTQTRTQTTPASTTDRRAYLLVFEGDSCRTVALPDEGELFIGRAPDCAVQVEDQGVSRKHVRLELRHGLVRVSDLGSHNGTRLNGRLLGADVVLSAGDTLTVSDCTLVLYCGARPASLQPTLSPKAFRARLDAEVERAMAYERPFCLACFRFTGSTAHVESKLGPALRLMDVATFSDDTLLVLLPEVEAEDAATAAGALAAALDDSARAGFARFPADGTTAETLLLCARQAVEAANAGGLEAAPARTLVMGKQRTVLLADPAMLRAYELLERLAKVAMPVLVLGETGAGKENAAYAVHHFSARNAGPFASLNCAALPEGLLESELFGHEKGAFTGATAQKPGLLEQGDGGTVFLDEVGELSLAAQARLLRVLETKTFTRVGGVKELTVNLRIVAATHRDLSAEIKAGRFREDLYFRLRAATVVLPPLRERPREIALLARHFLEAARHAPVGISAAAMARLVSHPWPGNVRELKHTLEFVAATVSDAVIEPWHLPNELTPPTAGKAPATTGFTPLAEEVRALELKRIKEALAACDGVQTRAAELLGMPRRTFVLRLRELRLNEQQ